MSSKQVYFGRTIFENISERLQGLTSSLLENVTLAIQDLAKLEHPTAKLGHPTVYWSLKNLFL